METEIWGCSCECSSKKVNKLLNEPGSSGKQGCLLTNSNTKTGPVES